MFWDLCLKYIQIYSWRKHVDLVKIALFGCWKFFCFIHIAQVFESDVAIAWDLNLIFDNFYSRTYCEKYSYRQKVDGFYHLEVECCYEEVNYWLFSENNVFMQKYFCKATSAFFALRNIVTQECRQKVSEVNLRSQISLSGPFYR